jgi:hypothetical protein
MNEIRDRSEGKTEETSSPKEERGRQVIQLKMCRTTKRVEKGVYNSRKCCTTKKVGRLSV